MAPSRHVTASGRVGSRTATKADILFIFSYLAVHGAVDHVFTHFALTLSVRTGEGTGDFLWTPADEARAVLPTVFRKALERGLAA